MNYLKTKTIQKQQTIIGSGFLSMLLLFFLLVSCEKGPGSPSEKKGGASEDHDTNLIYNESVHKKMLDKVGGIGPCGRPCLEKAFIEAAKDNGKKEDVEGQQSYIIPKKTKTGVPILQSLIKDRVVGDKEGKKKWYDWMLTEKQKGIKPKEGLHGKAGEMLTILAESRKKHKNPIIYAASLVMGLRTDLDESKDKKSKSVDRAKIAAALASFEKQIKWVSPNEGNGVLILISVDKNPAEIEYIPLKEKDMSKKGKCLVLPQDTYNQLMDKFKEIKGEVEAEAARLQ